MIQKLKFSEEDVSNLLDELQGKKLIEKWYYF